MSQSIMSEITKKLISESFKHLLNKKPLNKITIKEIVDNSKLTRQTFYYHFHDIYDLLAWTYKEDIGYLMDDPRNDNLSYAIESIISYISENKYMFKNTLQATGRDHLEKIIYPDLFQYSKNTIKNSPGYMNVPDEKSEFLANIYTLTIISIIVKWANNGMKENIHQCTKMLNSTINTAIFSILNENE